ncbi:MAG: hypothetical protein RJA70_3243 [Pseudomonadota bacterium]|jgi:hypothetical protein
MPTFPELSGAFGHSLFLFGFGLLVLLRMLLVLRILLRAMQGPGLAFAELARRYPAGERPPAPRWKRFSTGSGSMPFTLWWWTQATFTDSGMYVEFRGSRALIPWQNLRIESHLILWVLVSVVPERTLFVFNVPLMQRGALRRIRASRRGARG